MCSNSIIFKHISMHSKVAHPFFTCYFCFEYTLLPFSLYIYIFLKRTTDGKSRLSTIFEFGKAMENFALLIATVKQTLQLRTSNPKPLYFFVYWETTICALTIESFVVIFHFHYSLHLSVDYRVLSELELTNSKLFSSLLQVYKIVLFNRN